MMNRIYLSISENTNCIQNFFEFLIIVISHRNRIKWASVFLFPRQNCKDNTRACWRKRQEYV